MTSTGVADRVPTACGAPPPAALQPPDDDTLAALARALGHPSRLRILRLLAERQACVNREVVDELPLAQSTVSEHLRILRESGLVEVSDSGGRSTYCVSLVGLALLGAGVEALRVHASPVDEATSAPAVPPG